MSKTNDKERLLAKLTAKRHDIAAYVKNNEPKNNFLVTFSIVSGALAAALTAGPGIGGKEFIHTANDIMSFGMPIWQILCLAATLLSVMTVIANTLLKTNGMSTKISEARLCDSKLEGLETLLELDQIDVSQASQKYIESLATIPHI